MIEWLSTPQVAVWLGLIGTLASILGAAITVLYSKRAASAATAANQAASETRKQVKSINLLADLSAALAHLADLRRRVDSNSWEIVSERSQQVRLLMSPLGRLVSEVCGEDFGVKVGNIVVQMKVLGETSEKVRAETMKEPSKSKLHAMLADQSEEVVLIIAEVKERMGKNGA